MSNTPQPIPFHAGQRSQNFRKGDCGPYQNPVIYAAPNLKMPVILMRRPGGGDSTITAELRTLEDDTVATLTATTATIEAMDTEGENEALVFPAGDWVGSVSVPVSAFYYIYIDTGSEEWYSDEIYLMDDDANGYPEPCEDQLWVRLKYTIDGTKIYSGSTVANPSVPVNAFPLEPLNFFIYLDAVLHQPEWELEETGDTPNRFGFEPELRKSLVRSWRMGGKPVSEGVIDCLTIVSMGKDIELEFSDLSEIVGAKKTRVEPEWQQGGCRAGYSFFFQTDFFVKQGC